MLLFRGGMKINLCFQSFLIMLIFSLHSSIMIFSESTDFVETTTEPTMKIPLLGSMISSNLSLNQVDETNDLSKVSITSNYEGNLNEFQQENMDNTPSSSFYGKLSQKIQSFYEEEGYLNFSRFIGGYKDEDGLSVAIDSLGNIFLTGKTGGGDFPLLNAFDDHEEGGSEAFVTKLSSNGTILWSTYLGGNNVEYGIDVEVDNQNNAIVVGFTQSSDFPVLNEYYGQLRGDVDAFVTKISSSGSLLWSTYLGGNARERAYSVTVDSSNNVTITGRTTSSNFPIKDAWNSTFGGEGPNIHDTFVTKFSPSGGLIWSTFLGGSKDDKGYGVVSDDQDSLIITGSTTSDNFPKLNNNIEMRYLLRSYVTNHQDNGS